MIYEYFLSPSAWHLISSLILFYFAATVLYRLYLSPIAKFPGPKLAAVSFWYEFYYDVIKRGRYTWEIGRMHRKYGTILLPELMFCFNRRPRPNRSDQPL